MHPLILTQLAEAHSSELRRQAAVARRAHHFRLPRPRIRSTRAGRTQRVARTA